jgi:hypothetical protein
VAPDLLDRALRAVGLSRCDLVFPDERVERLAGPAAAHDPLRLPFFDALHRAPLRLPAFARETVGWLDEVMDSEAPVSRAIQVAALRLGHDVEAICPFPSPSSDPAPLATAVADLVTAAGGIPDRAALAADAADVPRPLQVALAGLLAAIGQAAREREAALASTAPTVRPVLRDGGPDLLRTATPGQAEVDRSGYRAAVSGETVDHARLYGAAARLARSIEVIDPGRLAGSATGPFDQSTPWGRVVVGGPDPDRYDPATRPGLAGDVLLLVDTGGDDVYRIAAGATGSLANPVSVVLDLAGHDTYGYVEVPDPRDGDAAARLPSDADGRHPAGPTRSTQARQGAGRLGIGLLLDLGNGHDRYRSLRMSQGFGRFGVGVLYDAGGDDAYQAEALAQGSAVHGIGLLLDRAGDDHYTSYVLSQGFGGVTGVGILVDGEGHDRYVVDHGDPAGGGDPLYSAPQLPGHSNASLSQGAGLGIRPSGAPGDTGAAGGLGVLRDRGTGDDVYVASVLAQGAGYWLGTGILQDAGGNDRYDGRWYVQGAAAHLALGYFADEAGDDRYDRTLVPVSTTLGVGHDLGAGLHLDLGGDDAYRGAVLTLGAGSAQGIGLFVNVGGADVYDGPARLGFGAATHGDASKGRAGDPTHGIFIDAGGTDAYRAPDRPPGTGNDATWRGRAEPPDSSGQGAGADDGEGTVTLP